MKGNFVQPDDSVLMLPVTWGDFLDRLAIQELKADRLPEDESRTNAMRQLARMRSLLKDRGPLPDQVLSFLDELRTVNASLWEAESAVRQARDAMGEHDRHENILQFCNIAEEILAGNERRATLKKAIDQAMGLPGENKHY